MLWKIGGLDLRTLRPSAVTVQSILVPCAWSRVSVQGIMESRHIRNMKASKQQVGINPQENT